jgi:two-component system, OmpR family, phosphate regulon response regulator PhoB
MNRRLLLVEDDRSLGATLTERLAKAGYEAVWVENLYKAGTETARSKFDLVILDVGLPDGSGFEFARQLRAHSGVPFIFVTAQASAEDRLRGYDLGAVEYIPKPFHLREFMMRVEHALSSHTLPVELRFNSVAIDVSGMMLVHDDGRRERLPARDFRLLQLLIERSPQVVSRDEILNALWGEDRFPSNRTIDNAIVRLRQALGPAGENLRSVRGVGYQWEKEGPANE